MRATRVGGRENFKMNRDAVDKQMVSISSLSNEDENDREKERATVLLVPDSGIIFYVV